MVAGLNHPNIIQVIDQGEAENGQPYFVMQYVKSIALTAVILRADVTLTRKLDIVIQITKALSYAHRNGVVHRDIKPANVLVDYEGHVRVVDFGIAGYFKKTGNKAGSSSQSVIMGTPAYMAPEQLDSHQEITELSDIYSLGVLMHELFVGCLPREQEGKPESLAAPLWELICNCLNKDVSLRPQSADDLAASLLGLLQGRHLRAPRWEKEQQGDALPGDYRLLDILKENAYGATYLVSEPKHKQWLVVKKQKLAYEGDAYSVSKTLTGVNHPHIASLYGTAKNDRVFIAVMEYVKGGSLQDRLTQAFTLERWLMLMQQVCRGLQYAHELGVVHGNLRPSNVLVVSPGMIKITDFGFLDHSAGGEVDWYQSPGEEKTVASDIYSVGAMLFHLLTGVVVRRGDQGVSNLKAMKKLPKALIKIVRKMLAINPEERYQSAEQVARELEQFCNDQQTVVVSPEPEVVVEEPKQGLSGLAKAALLLVFVFFVAESLWLFGGEGIGRFFK